MSHSSQLHCQTTVLSKPCSWETTEFTLTSFPDASDTFYDCPSLETNLVQPKGEQIAELSVVGGGGRVLAKRSLKALREQVSSSP